MNEPNIIEKAKNLIGAVSDWAKNDNFSKVSEDVFYYRKQICDNCPFWNPDGYAGIGKCENCGCSIAKLYIPSSVCPDSPPRWIAVDTKKESKLIL
jgi:hypothetical protein